MHRFGRVGENRHHDVAVYFLRHERNKRRGKPRQSFENREQRHVSRFLVLGHVAAPEALAASSDVPVAERVGKIAYSPCAFGNLVIFQRVVHESHKRIERRQNPLVHHVKPAIVKRIFRRVELIDFGVKNVERISVEQSSQKFTLDFAYGFIVESRRYPGTGIGVEIPSYGVRTLFVEYRPRVDDVALVLAHFDAVLVVDVA